MSRRKRLDALEIIRQKSSMSQRVVAEKDSDYALYAGADWITASKLAKVDFILRNKLVPEAVRPILKLYRSFLNQQRKAFFGSTSSEITKLGFMLGMKDDRIRATKKP